MGVVKQAIWIIERHLDDHLSLTELAAACRVSAWHLSHAFAESANMPLSAYVRGRRLSRAAERLAGGAPDILQIALESGYRSHEAFSRSFKKQFGVTPSKVRTPQSLEALKLLPAAELTDDLGPSAKPISCHDCPALEFVGIAGVFSPGEMQNIPGLWRRFMSVYPSINHQRGGAPVGICRAPISGPSFEYACATEVDEITDVPAGAKGIRVPAARYAVFRHAGHVSTVRGTYRKIFDHALPEHNWTIPDGPVLEKHDTGFDPVSGEGGIAIWVPIVAGV
jgi:AraC family transcriptional regulator